MGRRVMLRSLHPNSRPVESVCVCVCVCVCVLGKALCTTPTATENGHGQSCWLCCVAQGRTRGGRHQGWLLLTTWVQHGNAGADDGAVLVDIDDGAHLHAGRGRG